MEPRKAIRLLDSAAEHAPRLGTAVLRSPWGRSRWSAVGLVLGIHLLALWLLANSFVPIARDRPAPEAQIVLLQSSEPRQPVVPEPQMIDPAAVLVAPPEIDLQQDSPSTAIQAVAAESQVLAPRPDPSYNNGPPPLPASLRGPGRPSDVVLRVLIEPHGTVDDAQIARSSGTAQLDEWVIAFVKAHWRFLPATLDGHAIQYWTTVMVPFSPAP
jgi:periplasmic protein TonB